MNAHTPAILTEEQIGAQMQALALKEGHARKMPPSVGPFTPHTGIVHENAARGMEHRETILRLVTDEWQRASDINKGSPVTYNTTLRYLRMLEGERVIERRQDQRSSPVFYRLAQ